jgi:hypothetical protein
MLDSTAGSNWSHLDFNTIVLVPGAQAAFNAHLISLGAAPARSRPTSVVSGRRDRWKVILTLKWGRQVKPYNHSHSQLKEVFSKGQ